VQSNGYGDSSNAAHDASVTFLSHRRRQRFWKTSPEARLCALQGVL